MRNADSQCRADIDDRRDLTQLVTSIFESWKASGVAFVVLRNYDTLPASTSNDIDVLVCPGQLAAAERSMLTAARHAGYTLHNRVRFSPIAYFFFHTSSNRQIQIDLYSSLQWHWMPMLLTEPVLAARIERGLFDIAAPVHEAAISLLTRLIYTGKVKENYKRGIANGFSEAREEASRILAAAVGERLAFLYVDAVVGERWAQVEGLGSALRKALIWHQITQRPWNTLKAFLRDMFRLLDRLIRPPGITIGILPAPAGCHPGVGNEIVQRLRGTFNPGRGIVLTPEMFGAAASRAKAGRPLVTQSGARVRSLMLSRWRGLDDLLRFNVRRHLALSRNGLVLIDGYSCHRSKEQPPQAVPDGRAGPRWVWRLANSADLVFVVEHHLQVTDEPNTPLSDSGSNADAFHTLAGQSRNRVCIDGSQPTEHIVANIVDHVLWWMAERITRRQ
jgi:hypothetical protein